MEKMESESVQPVKQMSRLSSEKQTIQHIWSLR